MNECSTNFIPVITPNNEILSTLYEAAPTSEAFKSALEEVAKLIKSELKSGKLGVLIELAPTANQARLDVEQIHEISPVLGTYFGNLLVQNEAGDRVISVYDRDRYGSMFSGARYHQTREGGSIHTDNVNIPEYWEYLMLTCLAPGQVGGENILVSAVAVHQELKAKYPDVLKTLEGNFMWEMRGVSASLYEAPIITYDESGLPRFRHLRPYMESAHAKAEKPLTAEQLYALDVLDALTNSSELQQRYRMKKGDILFTLDSQVLHGRTCFSDALEAIAYPDFINGAKKGTLKRTMERLWIKQ